MKRSGCHIISLGVESGDQQMLDRMQKGITLDESRNAVALCKRYSVDAYMFFIIGLPWETAETVRKTIDFALELDGDFAEFILARCFPGTKLYDICKDLDILIQATRENAQNLLAALEEAGLGTASLITAEELLNHEITIFKDYVRIDVQTSTPGIHFEDAWKKRETMDYEGQTFFVISKDDLIASKRAAGREIDLEDVRLLELKDDEGAT
jgi:radical SAM superfamily enzyme YgiQ (UPF0313 family)